MIAIYLIGIFGVGIGLASLNNSTSDMFAAGGKSPWWTSGLSAFMTMFSANTFVVWGGIAYRLGMVAVLINLMYGVSALLVGYFVAGRWKRLGVETPAEFIQLRYGTGALHFFTWFMTVFKMLTTAGALYAMGRILVTLMPLSEGNPLQDPVTGNLSLNWAIIILSSLVVIYTMIGGLWAVLMTDVLQFIVLNLAVLFVIPLVISQANGVSGATEGLSKVSVDAAGHNMLSPIAGDYSYLFLVGWCIIHFFIIGAEWAFVQRFICVPDEKSARLSTYLFGILYLVSPILWLLPPIIYRLVDGIPDGLPPELFQYVPESKYAGLAPDIIASIQAGDLSSIPEDTINKLRSIAIQFKSETAYIEACRSVLPIGMMGLMFAAMFSATASMVSSQLNVFSGVFTNDIYRPLTKSAPTANKLLWVGRGFTVLLGALLIGIALAYQALGGAEKVIVKSTEAVVVALLAPTVWGLFSRKVNSSAVWITAAVGMIAGVVVRLGFASGGFLTEVDSLASITQLVQDNMKIAETISGVILPVAVLLLLEIFSTSTSKGYSKVVETVSQRIPSTDEKPDTEASSLPAIIVGWALVACGLMMLGLIPINPDHRLLIFAFSAVLFVIASAILTLTSSETPKA